MITVETISDIHEFESLRDEWNSLLRDSRSDSLFLTWEWLFTWWKVLGAHFKLNIVRVRSGSTLLALLPLFRGQANALKFQPACLEFLGSGAAGSDYLDFIVKRDIETEVLEHVGQVLLKNKQAVQLSHCLKGSSAVSFLLHSWKVADAQSRRQHIGTCPFIVLSGHTWDSYLASLGSEHRYNFKRRLKNLQAKFVMRLEAVQDEEGRKTALENLIRLHNLRRSSLNGSEAFNTPALCSFHDELSRIALQKTWLRLYTLWLDGRPAASLYGFYYKRIFYFYQSGFDPAFKEFSVGLVIMGLAIRCAIEEGAIEYDFLHGAEPYKFLWTKRVRHLDRLELYPPGLEGRIWKIFRESNDGMRVMARKMLSSFGAARVIPATIKSGGTVYVAGHS